MRSATIYHMHRVVHLMEVVTCVDKFVGVALLGEVVVVVAFKEPVPDKMGEVSTITDATAFTNKGELATCLMAVNVGSLTTIQEVFSSYISEIVAPVLQSSRQMKVDLRSTTHTS